MVRDAVGDTCLTGLGVLGTDPMRRSVADDTESAVETRRTAW